LLTWLIEYSAVGVFGWDGLIGLRDRAFMANLASGLVLVQVQVSFWA
jgi:hypothetical protein